MKFKIEVDLEDLVSYFDSDKEELKLAKRIEDEVISQIVSELMRKIKTNDLTLYGENRYKEKIDNLVEGYTQDSGKFWLESDLADSIMKRLVSKLMPDLTKRISGIVLQDVSFKDSVVKEVIKKLK